MQLVYIDLYVVSIYCTYRSHEVRGWKGTQLCDERNQLFKDKPVRGLHFRYSGYTFELSMEETQFEQP